SCAAEMSQSSVNTLIDSEITLSRDAPPFGSGPGTTTMHGQPTAVAMLLSSSHTCLIDSYACASRNVMCSIELMLKGLRPDSAKRSFSSVVDPSLRNFLSFAAQISR